MLKPDVDPFKACSGCAQVWGSREVFLADPKIELVGYQAFLDDLGLGLFLFNHKACGTTLAIRAGLFEDLYHGPIYSERLDNTDSCPDHCLSSENLKPCPEACECAYVREILQTVINWPKNS